VFLAYSTEKGAAFLDRAPYLPRAWTGDPVRRAEAGVPAGLIFRNKIELAEEMLERAFEDDVPARWVVADSFYGRSHAFRVWLEERGRGPTRCDGPQDQRRATRRAYEEDREARPAAARRRLLGGPTCCCAGCQR